MGRVERPLPRHDPRRPEPRRHRERHARLARGSPERPAITFLRDDGAEADAAYLDDPGNDFLAFRIDGEEAGDSVRSIFVAYNGYKDGIHVTLPTPATGYSLYLMADTHQWLEDQDNFFTDADAPALDEPTYLLGKRSVLILVERR